MHFKMGEGRGLVEFVFTWIVIGLFSTGYCLTQEHIRDNRRIMITYQWNNEKCNKDILGIQFTLRWTILKKNQVKVLFSTEPILI